MSTLKPEEVYLAILCHYFVHPPEFDQLTGVQFQPMKSSQCIARFLLKVLKTEVCGAYPSLSQLCVRLVQQLEALGGELVRQLEVILQGLSTPDDLVNMMEATSQLLVNGRTAGMSRSIGGIAPTSVMGLFLRKVRAKFLLAPYSQLITTSTALKADLVAAAQAAAEQNNGMNTAYDEHGQLVRSDACDLPPVVEEVPKGSLMDAPSVERFLVRQLGFVRQHGARALAGGVTHLVDRIVDLHKHNLCDAGRPAGSASSALPRALQLQLATALHQGDYTQALHVLHTYSDTVQASTSNPDSTSAPSTSTTNTAASSRAKHHSALLSLAALHTHFGHTQEALDSLHEALRSASQQSDPASLLHCLAGLCHVMATAVPGSPGFPELGLESFKDGGHHVQLKKMLDRCLSRAQELNSPHIAAFAKMALSRWTIQHHVQPPSSTTFDTMNNLQQQQPLATPGDPSQPSDTDEDVRYQDASGTGPSVVTQVSEAARKVLHVAHRTCIEAAAPCGMTQTVPDASAATPGAVNVVPLVPFLFGQPQVLKQPSQWRVGSSIAKATMQQAVSCHLLQSAAWSSVGHQSLAGLYSIAYLACAGEHSKHEDTQTALAQLIEAISALHGPAVGDAACSIAATCVSTAHEKTCPHLAASMAKTRHAVASSQGRVHAARRALKQLASCTDPGGCVRSDVTLEAQHMAACDAASREDWVTARNTALACFHAARSVGDQSMSERCLLLLGRIWLSSGQPHQAQPYLYSCWVHASEANHDAVAAEAALLLMRTWLEGGPQLLPELLNQIQPLLPVVLAQGRLEVRSECCWSLADALLSAGGDASDPAASRVTALPPHCSLLDSDHVPNEHDAGNHKSSGESGGPTLEQVRWRSGVASKLLRAAMQGYQQLGRYEEAARAGSLLATLHHELGDSMGCEREARTVLEIESRMDAVRLCDA